MSDSVLIGIEARAFNATIRNRRKELGLTQAGLAAKAGVGRGTVAQLETLRQTTVTPSARRVLNVLGLTEDASPRWLAALELYGTRRVERSVTAEMIGAPTYLELPPGDPIVDPEEDYTANAERERIRDALDILTARERYVISKRYGLDDEPQTLERIAQDLGITSARVQQIEIKALVKLRTFFHVHELRGGSRDNL